MRAGTAIASGARHIIGVSLQALIIAAIVVALAFAAAVVVGSSPSGADSVFAAKGGNGRGGHGVPATTSSASLTVTPHNVAVGETFAISGSGFDPSRTTYLLVKKPSSTTFFYAAVAADGTLAATTEVWETGSTLIEAYQLSLNGASQLVATGDVEVN